MKYPADREYPEAFKKYKTASIGDSVVQDDGQIAYFIMNSDSEYKWKFCYYVDEHGFSIWEDDMQDSYMSELMTNNEIPLDDYRPELGDFIDEVKKTLKEDEELKLYKYGGVLSLRVGLFVIDTKTKYIKKSKMCIMS